MPQSFAFPGFPSMRYKRRRHDCDGNAIQMTNKLSWRYDRRPTSYVVLSPCKNSPLVARNRQHERLQARERLLSEVNPHLPDAGKLCAWSVHYNSLCLRFKAKAGVFRQGRIRVIASSLGCLKCGSRNPLQRDGKATPQHTQRCHCLTFTIHR